MAAELSVLSFFCAILLGVFLPVKRVRTSVPRLAILLWLIGCNLVHGINALIWAGNVDIHVPAWCDIVIELVLAANIALPGAFLCISRDLELVSSKRKIDTDPKAIRNRTLIEVSLCYIIPVIYLALHLVAQDHRFDLVKNFGCSASTHPSVAASVIAWGPPFVACSISFVLIGLAISNSFRMHSARFSTHLSSRSTMTTSLFIRQLATSLLMTGVLILIILFSIFSVPTLQPWVSWASVHSQLSVIDIISNPDDMRAAQLQWWGVFVISVVYILLSFALGEEARDMFKWACSQIWKRQPRRPFILANHRLKTPEPQQMSSRSPSSQGRPLTIELKSGWDDTLNFKVSKNWGSSKKSKSVISSSRCTPSPSPTMTSMTTGDEVFMASTLSYLGSPPAQSLGIAIPRSPIQTPSTSPIQAPSPTYNTLRRAMDLSPPSLVKPTSPTTLPQVRAPPGRALIASMEKNKSSELASMLGASWPVPPASPDPSLPSRHGSPTSPRSHYSSPISTPPQSRSHSPALSEEEIDVCGYPPSLIISTSFDIKTHSFRPFGGSSISSMSDIGASSTPTVGAGSRPRISSLRRSSLQRSWSQERIGQGYFPSNDGIHMTVVQETV